MRTRIDIFTQMTARGLTGIGVEVGVMCGTFSRQILQAWPGTLVMVDSWSRRPDCPELLSSTDEEQLNGYIQTYLATREFGDRAIIMKSESTAAASMFKDRSLDWVYIDASHSFENVCADIDAWLPKIKPNGILCGHDYHDNQDQPYGKCEVKRAVRKYFSDETVYVTRDDLDPSWLVEV